MNYKLVYNTVRNENDQIVRRDLFIEVTKNTIESKEEVEYFSGIVSRYFNKHMGNGYCKIGEYCSADGKVRLQMDLGSLKEKEKIDELYKVFKGIASTGNKYFRTPGIALKNKLIQDYLVECSNIDKETLMEYVNFRAEQLRLSGKIVF